MLWWTIYLMIFSGSAIMVYNIWCFISYVRFIRRAETWQHSDRILYVPTALLVMFLLGYLALGIFGDPDLIAGGILFGGSAFLPERSR